VNDRLFEELRPVGFAVAYRMVGSVREAADIVQEAFLLGAIGGVGAGALAAIRQMGPCARRARSVVSDTWRSRVDGHRSARLLGR
jgi:Sigma-70 region 2